ncbi:MAG: hypothetical protein UT05_C0003G0055 [Parcubacteria group bacterium GW2011_GWF2_38_76]|nr:MAG: hypothetical protein UT05_C0003G0055 [Parcubacteria group bacterium GW2011_GWF2_38_76]HBM46173.1 hypothetical protein [Patescibacteria group bacterium]
MVLDISKAVSVYKQKLLAYLKLCEEMEKKYNIKETNSVLPYFYKLSDYDWKELDTKSKELIAIEEVLHFTKEEIDSFLKEERESLEK